MKKMAMLMGSLLAVVLSANAATSGQSSPATQFLVAIGDVVAENCQGVCATGCSVCYAPITCPALTVLGLSCCPCLGALWSCFAGDLSVAAERQAACFECFPSNSLPNPHIKRFVEKTNCCCVGVCLCGCALPAIPLLLCACCADVCCISENMLRDVGAVRRGIAEGLHNHHCFTAPCGHTME